MIDFIKMTPKIYSSESRDYQILANIYTVLFNYCRLYSDSMNFWDSSIDDKLVDLRVKTLNLRVKHKWDLDDLAAVTNCFKAISRVKGTKNAIYYCILILMRINNINEHISVENISLDATQNLVISIPAKLSGVGILTDLLEYIIPAGITYRIVVRIEYHNTVTSTVGVTSDITNTSITNSNMGIYLSSEGQALGSNSGYSILHNAVNDGIEVDSV